VNTELQTLVAFLDQQRAHILKAATGLSDEQLRRPVLPSGWTSLGLVKHLTLDVEHYWFRCIVAGESLDFFPEGADAWKVDPGESADDILKLYRDECALANEIVAQTTPETRPRQRDDHWGDWELHDVRSVLLHVLSETACHAGHLDAAVELIDGRQWLVL